MKKLKTGIFGEKLLAEGNYAYSGGWQEVGGGNGIFFGRRHLVSTTKNYPLPIFYQPYYLISNITLKNTSLELDQEVLLLQSSKSTITVVPQTDHYLISWSHDMTINQFYIVLLVQWCRNRGTLVLQKECDAVCMKKALLIGPFVDTNLKAGYFFMLLSQTGKFTNITLHFF